LYASADSSSSFFWDAIGEIKYLGADGDSLGKPHILLGQLGTRIRGTLFNSVGYYLRLSNGVRLGGTSKDAVFAAGFEPVLASTRKFVGEGAKTYDSFEGYLRYAPAGDWLGLTIGREFLKFGTGFIDKLIVSNQNSAPFDFIKLDLSYKKIKYSFFHSSIVGNDASGNQLPAGDYTFEIKAKDISGAMVNVVTNSFGTVTGVNFENGLSYLVLNDGRNITLSEIKSIR